MIIKSNEDVYKVERFVKDNDKLAFDIETNSLQPRGGKIIGFGFSNSKEGFYIAHLEWDGDKLIERVSLDNCKKVLNILKTKKWVGWNSSFEVRFVKHYCNIDLSSSLYSDGMLAVHTVDENKMSYALKILAADMFGKSATEEQKLMKDSIVEAGGNPSSDYFMANVDLLGKYCIQDCLLTYKIDENYVEKIHSEGLDSFYFKDEVMPLYKEVTIGMEDTGVKLNLELIEKTKEDITADINLLKEKIHKEISPLLDQFEKWYLNKEIPPRRSGQFAQYICKYANLDLPKTSTGKYSVSVKNLEELEDSIYKTFLMGGEYLPNKIVLDIQKLWWSDQDQKYMFNISSKDHLKRLFFDKLEEVPTSKTEKGNPQADVFFLQKMSEKYEWAKNLIVFNKLCKLRSAYMTRFLDSQIDGIFYPSFFQHRTISGRYGSNLQQLPRPKEDGEDDSTVIKYNNLVRKFFVSRNNFVFIDSDYESLEPHVFAHVSGDNGLKDIFKKGHDFYSTIAINTEQLENVSADKKASNYLGKVDKPLRQKAKAYSLGVPYGLGGYALSKQLNISQKEADQLVDNYLKAFPELSKWMSSSKEQCVTKGFVQSEAGRIRHMESAPKIWYAHSEYILDSLKLWKKYHDSPKKYKQMKFLHKQIKNYINNSRNFQIQSLAASITNRACIAINRELVRKKINGRVIAQIHDQIIVEVPKKYAEQCKKLVQYIMENNYKLSLKLKAPAEIGVDFYEAH